MKVPTGSKWSKKEIELFKQHYPKQGLKWCANFFQRSDIAIRSKASKLHIKQDRTSDFFKEWQYRAAKSKIGRHPRPPRFPRKPWKMKDAQKELISKRTKEWIRVNGHPRGMNGKRHTKETLSAMSTWSKNHWTGMNKEQKNKQISKALKAKILKYGTLVSNPSNRLGASWKAGWREIGGKKHYFRSRWEANYARYLQWKKERNEIKDWEFEPDTFWFNNIKRGVRSYLPDFKVFKNDGTFYYDEVKGWFDDRSKTKMKRMKKYYPKVVINLIQAPWFKASKNLKLVIKEWE